MQYKIWGGIPMPIREKGQGMIEVAVVFLMLLPLLVGVYLIFMLCYDYMTLASLARESARALAVQTEANMTTERNAIITRKTGSSQNALLGSLYIWSPSSSSDAAFTVELVSSETDPHVTVTLTAARASDGLASYLNILPPTITAQSTMYWEGYSANDDTGNT